MCGDEKYYARLWKKQAEERKQLEQDNELEHKFKTRDCLERMFRPEIEAGLCPARIHTIDAEITAELMR